MSVLFGIDVLLANPALLEQLQGKRVALVAHPASVTADLTHSLDCDVAVLLNITPDHLDRYDGSFEQFPSSGYTGNAASNSIPKLRGATETDHFNGRVLRDLLHHRMAFAI